MKRQGLNVSIRDLRLLTKELIDQQLELEEELKLNSSKIDYEQKYMVGIINKEGMSDTWELEL
jgi:hypothetical protein